MRRFRQQLPEADTARILRESTNAVLSLIDTDSTPYGVPISYVWDGADTIYMHSAVSGRKIDCIRHCGKASLCIVAQDCVVPEEFTTYFKSVIADGDIGIVVDEEEAVMGLRMLADKYSPGLDSTAEIARGLKHVAVLRLRLNVVRGKESIELTRDRNAK